MRADEGLLRDTVLECRVRPLRSAVAYCRAARDFNRTERHIFEKLSRTEDSEIAEDRAVHKNKSHRGAKKRFKVTAGGKVMRNNSMRSHILTKKTTKRKRRLRRPSEVVGRFARKVKEIM